ncbi:conserved hypothetical protein [Agrobacterium deltaense Zutra 3/1]|uniref:Uncharacterized protein n=1 Tax=Agrobacterium deltaense Zutra 3/1 TaxID=1183427 RepID=A0A1S7PSQ0_9HYPH|nr:conserved hypothetical protein [Agrobacterium deltaense Zutra 3/1]
MQRREERKRENWKIAVLIVVKEGFKSNSKLFVKFAAKSLISAARDI